jgi:hypothetical protein
MLDHQFRNFEKHRGAVEARRAHNPDVVGSKPTGANFFWRALFALLRKKAR